MSAICPAPAGMGRALPAAHFLPGCRAPRLSTQGAFDQHHARGVRLAACAAVYAGALRCAARVLCSSHCAPPAGRPRQPLLVTQIGAGLLLHRPADASLAGAAKDWGRMLMGARLVAPALAGAVLMQPVRTPAPARRYGIPPGAPTSARRRPPLPTGPPLPAALPASCSP